jgi:isoquinoline 1-oxidoreductase subunit alpha
MEHLIRHESLIVIPAKAGTQGLARAKPGGRDHGIVRLGARIRVHDDVDSTVIAIGLGELRPGILPHPSRHADVDARCQPGPILVTVTQCETKGATASMIKLNINGQAHDVDVDPDTPLLWVIREWVGMTGTKYGCGIAQCGACTVHLDGVATRSCSVPVGSVGDVKITTIEGLSPDGLSHPVQAAWLQHDVPQCGYCQSGQIMAAAALLKATPKPTDADIDAAMTNICRCGTYQRIREAIHTAASMTGKA